MTSLNTPLALPGSQVLYYSCLPLASLLPSHSELLPLFLYTLISAVQHRFYSLMACGVVSYRELYMVLHINLDY